jgi:hypothetical protein
MAKPTKEELEYRIKSSLGTITSVWIDGIIPHLVRSLDNAANPTAQPLEFLELRVYRDKISVRSVSAPLPPESQRRIDSEVTQVNEFLKLLQ